MKKSKIAPTNFENSILRILVTLSVIIIHLSGPLVVKIEKMSIFIWYVAIFTIVLVAMQFLFFLISGSFLTGRQSDIKDFLKNRLGKIIPPFMFRGCFIA